MPPVYPRPPATMRAVTDHEATPDAEKHPVIAKMHERRERHQDRHKVVRAGVVILGVAITLAGLVMTGPVPGPGVVVIPVGLALLALEFTWAERLLDFTKRHVKRWTDWVGRQPLWVKGLISLATAAFVCGVLVVTLHMTGVPRWVPGWVPLWR